MFIHTEVEKKLAVTIGASATQISATPILTTRFEVYNKTGNADIYLGDSTVDNTWIPLAADTSKVYTIEYNKAEPKQFDLSKWFISGTNGNQVIVQYSKRG